MLQNDIGEENDNDGFIIPETRDLSERDDDRFISYLRFLTKYWNCFPQHGTRDLGTFMT